MIGLFLFPLAIVSLSLGSPQELFQKNHKAVATIKWQASETAEPISLGTAFFLDESFIITNIHVAAAQGMSSDFTHPFLQMHNGEQFSLFSSFVAVKNSNCDIVAIEISDSTKTMATNALNIEDGTSFKDYFDIPTITISNDAPKVGDEIYIIGSPLGLDQTLTNGILSSIRNINGFGECYQTTAAISPGSSGSPAFNANGELIGIATFKSIGGESLNFLVPVDRLSNVEVVDQLLILWAKKTVTASEQEFANSIYTSALSDLIDDAISQKDQYDTKQWDTLLSAIEHINNGTVDNIDKHDTKPPRSSWNILSSASFNSMHDPERFQAILNDAHTLESTGSADIKHLRMAASFGASEARNKYLEAMPGDDVIRWERVNSRIHSMSKYDPSLIKDDPFDHYTDAVTNKLDLLQIDLAELPLNWANTCEFHLANAMLQASKGDFTLFNNSINEALANSHKSLLPSLVIDTAYSDCFIKSVTMAYHTGLLSAKQISTLKMMLTEILISNESIDSNALYRDIVRIKDFFDTFVTD